jgi:hypothetical protein
MLSAAPKRLRLIPLLPLLGFAGLLVFLLVLAFPRASLQQRLLGNLKADDLAVAYLEAWQRVEPHNTDVLTTLSREYLKGNRPGDAQQLLASLRASADPVARQNALLIEIGLAQTALFATRAPALHLQKQQVLASLLSRALTMPWDARQLEALAEAARQGGAQAEAGRFYLRLSQVQPERASYWLDKSAVLFIAQGQYREAAQNYFSIQAHAATLDDQRHAFIRGLGALQMGSHLVEAMAAAQQHGSQLLSDAETLRYLTHLALASGRPDLAQFYVQKLLALHGPVHSGASALQVAPGAWLAVSLRMPRAAVVQSDWQPVASARHEVVVVDPRRYMPSAAAVVETNGFVHVAATVKSSSAGNVGQDLELAYQVFMANGNLSAAQQLAKQALAQHQSVAVWRPRLAQVSLWNHDPATALAQYLAIGQQTQDPKVWQEITRLALALNDATAQLAVSLHASASHPSDMVLLDRVVAAYELAGQPERALSWLVARQNGVSRQPVLERVAALATRMGRDALAFETYQTLERSYGPNVGYALKLSQQLYLRAEFKAALAALQPAVTQAQGNQAFWTAYATLSTLTQQPQQLALAHRQLLQSGPLESATLAQMMDASASQPLQAARIAEYGYQQTGRVQALARTIDGYNRGRAFSRNRILLSSLSSETLALAEADPDFRMARSEYLRQTGQSTAAHSDLEAALVLAPERADIRAGFLWWLIEQGSDADLAAALQRYAAQAEDSAPLIGVYAAGYLRLGQAHQALHYFHLERGARAQDPLWLLACAEALELNQQTGAAWRLRRYVWRDLLPRALKRAPTAESRSELRAAYALLSDGLSGGDRSLTQLRQAMVLDTQKAPDSDSSAAFDSVPGMPALAVADDPMSPAVRDAALAWTLSHNAYAQEKDWLARHYANWLAQPAAAQYSLALAENDQVTLKRLLREKRNQLPLESRIEALVAQDLPADAESEAFAAQERQNNSDAVHAILSERLLASAQALSFGWRTVRQGGIKYEESTLGAGMRLTPNQSLSVLFDQRNQHTDRVQFPLAPGQDHGVSISYLQRSVEHSERLTVGQHQGWRATNPLLLETSWHDTAPLSFSAALGYQQAASETSQLLLGGMKNLARLGVNWRSGTPWFASAQNEFARYYMQNGSFLGEGYQLSLDSGYKIESDYPDWTVHAVFTHGQYSGYGRPTRPELNIPPGSEADFAQSVMPQTFSQAGMLLSMGTDLPEGYSRAWRPYLEMGPVYDTHAHWGVNTRVGLVSSVTGGDRLHVYYQHQDMSAQGSSAVTEIGLRYSWFY